MSLSTRLARSGCTVRPAATSRARVVAPKAILGQLFSAGPKGGAEEGFYSFACKDIDGKNVKMSTFKNKAVLVVNLASACGFTPQYTELQALQDKFGKRGFTVVGFPCNQFGAQEPGSNSSIKSFAKSNYGVTFPLFSKVDVNGASAEPLFDYLKTEKAGIFGSKDIKWNFSKFLVSKDGDVVGRYGPTSTPASLEKEIEKLLA